MHAIVFLNRFFRRPAVGARDSAEDYWQWEYRWGKQLIKEYLEPAGDLARKRVLDIGCGLGGKTVAYGEAGARAIFGVDISLDHILASERFVREKPRAYRWGFLASDAADLPLPDRAFDTVIANDTMEHFAEPEAALAEMVRVTRVKGAIWVFFTPHFSPLGSHLYDYIYIPWCHLLFRRGVLESGIREVLATREPERPAQDIEEEVRVTMEWLDSDLNRMSIRRFFRIVRRFSELAPTFTELKPAKYRSLKLLTGVPFVRELFTGTVICRLERKH